MLVDKQMRARLPDAIVFAWRHACCETSDGHVLWITARSNKLEKKNKPNSLKRNERVNMI